MITHPRVDGFIHAEQDALLNTKEECDTILVVRIGKQGVLRCSKPCPKCEEFLRAHKIHTVYYINWSGEIQEMTL